MKKAFSCRLSICGGHVLRAVSVALQCPVCAPSCELVQLRASVVSLLLPVLVAIVISGVVSGVVFLTVIIDVISDLFSSICSLYLANFFKISLNQLGINEEKAIFELFPLMPS